MALKLEAQPMTHLEDPLEHRLLGPIPRESVSVGLEREPRLAIITGS